MKVCELMGLWVRVIVGECVDMMGDEWMCECDDNDKVMKDDNEMI